MIRKRSLIFCLLLFFVPVMLLSAASSDGQTSKSMKHVIVYRAKNRFGGWPANNGIWAWGDEIVVGFTLGWHDDEKSGGHPIDGDKPIIPRQARSLDGGLTWSIETPDYLDDEGSPRPLATPEGGINFLHPDFALIFLKEGSNHGYSSFCYSCNRCKKWRGPFRLPTFNRKGIFARTDYMVNGRHDLFAFLTAAKDDGDEGWPFCARTRDGGKTWEHIGWIGPQPGRGEYAIMPSTLRLRNGALLSMIRRRGVFPDKRRWWLEPYLSPDDGRTWSLLARPRIDNAGNPAHMIRLRDGRIALTYGWRSAPYGIRVQVSGDEGLSWSKELVLRSDGGSWDLGYPRTVERTDGKCVTVYYFNDATSKERYIAATIWDPDLCGVKKTTQRRPPKESASSEASTWTGPMPHVASSLLQVADKLKSYDVILQPDKDAPQWWAGAPSVVRDVDGTFWMACRMRTAESPRGLRGYEIRLLKSRDGVHFTKVKSIRREQVPIPGFERPALLIDPATSRFKLYLCGPWKNGPWCILKLDDVETPEQFDPSTAKPVIRPPEKQYPRDVSVLEYKDPFILYTENRYHCYVTGYIRRNERIFHFTSPNGETWRPAGDTKCPIMDLAGWHDFFVRPASVVPAGVGYLFFYEGSSTTWYDPVYNIGTGLGFTFDRHRIIDLTPESPLALSTTPGRFHTWRYSHWMWVDRELWVYAEVAKLNDSNEIRLFRLKCR